MSDHSHVQNNFCNKVPEARLLAEEDLEFQLLGEGNDNCVVSIIGTGLVIRIKKVDAQEAHRVGDASAQQDGSTDISSDFLQKKSSSLIYPSSHSLPYFGLSQKNEIVFHQQQTEKDGDVLAQKTSTTFQLSSVPSCSIFECRTGHISWNKLCATGCPKCSLVHQCCRDLAFLNFIAYSLFGPALVKPGRLVSLSPGTLMAIRKLLQRTREEGRLHKTINPYGIAILCPDASTLFHGCHERSLLQSPSVCRDICPNCNHVAPYSSTSNDNKALQMKEEEKHKNEKYSLPLLSSETDHLRQFMRKKQRISRLVCNSEQCITTFQASKHWKVSMRSFGLGDDSATHQSDESLPAFGLKTSSLPNECSFMSWNPCERAALSAARRAPLELFVSDVLPRSPPSCGGSSLNSTSYLTKSAIEAKKKMEKLKVQRFLSQVMLDECSTRCGQCTVCKCIKKRESLSVKCTSHLQSINYLDGLPLSPLASSKDVLYASMSGNKDEQLLDDTKDFHFRKTFVQDGHPRLYDHLSKTDSLFFDSRLKNSRSLKIEDSGQTHEVPNREPVTLCVELKPKQGFLEPVKGESMQLCRFCLKQFIKCSKREPQIHSNYCPLDLFSGNIGRMSSAVGQLFAAPQNNLRIFKDGAIVDNIAPYSYLSEVLPHVLLSRPYGDEPATAGTVASEDQNCGSDICAPAPPAHDMLSASRRLPTSLAIPQHGPHMASFIPDSVHKGYDIPDFPVEHHAPVSMPSHAFLSSPLPFTSHPASFSTCDEPQSSPDDQLTPVTAKPTHSSSYSLPNSASLSVTSQTMDVRQSPSGDACANKLKNISFTREKRILRDDSGNSSDSGTDNEFPFVDGCENIITGTAPTMSSKLSSDSLLSSISDCNYSLNSGVELQNFDSSSEEVSIEGVEFHSAHNESQGISTSYLPRDGCPTEGERVVTSSQITVEIDETEAGCDNDPISEANVSTNSISGDVELQEGSLFSSCQDKMTPVSSSSLESNQCINYGLPFDSILGKVYNSQVSQLDVIEAFEVFQKLTDMIGEDEAYKRLWVIPDAQGNDVCQLFDSSGCSSLQSCLEEWNARTNCKDFDGIFCKSLRFDDSSKFFPHVAGYCVHAASNSRFETSETVPHFSRGTKKISRTSSEHEKKQQTRLNDEKQQNYYRNSLNSSTCGTAVNSFNLMNSENCLDSISASESEINDCNNLCDTQKTFLPPLHCRDLRSELARCVQTSPVHCAHCSKFDTSPSSSKAIMPNLQCCDDCFRFVDVAGSLDKTALVESSVSSCELFSKSSNLNGNVESRVLTRIENDICETLPDKTKCIEPVRRCTSNSFLKDQSSSFICSSKSHHDARSRSEGSCSERDAEIKSLVAQIQDFLTGLTFKDCSLMILLSGPHHEATMDEALCRDPSRCFTSSERLAGATGQCGQNNLTRNTNSESDHSAFSANKNPSSMFKSSSECRGASFPATRVPSLRSSLLNHPTSQPRLPGSPSPVVSCPFSPSGCPFWVGTPAGWYLCQVTVIDLVSKDPRKVKHHFKAVHELTQLVKRRRQRGQPLPACCVLPPLNS